MYESLVVVLVLAGLIIWPMALTIPIGLWEKRLVWPYVPLDPAAFGIRAVEFDAANPYAATASTMDEVQPPLTPYAARAAEGALSMGFVPVGSFRDGKGAMYRIRYEFYLSPERAVLALVGGGAIAAIPLNGTWLFTLLADGRCLRTVDNQTCSEADLSGLTDEALIAGVEFEELVARHRGRLAASFTRTVPYDERDPLEDHREYSVRRADRLYERGLIRFLDFERNWWRYGMRGAVVWALRAHFRGLRRAVWPDAWLRPGAGKQRK